MLAFIAPAPDSRLVKDAVPNNWNEDIPPGNPPVLIILPFVLSIKSYSFCASGIHPFANVKELSLTRFAG